MIKSILRKLKRNISFTIIKVIGLAIGLACSLTIILWIFDELKYDKYIDDSNDIYRVLSYGKTYIVNGAIWLPGPLTPEAKEKLPQVKDYMRITFTPKIVLKHSEKKLSVEKGLIADSNFFSFFNFNMQYGNAETCLQNSNSIVISDDLADKFFGETNPMGKLLESDEGQFMITGVMSIPENSSLVPDFIIPISYLESKGSKFTYWSRLDVIAYLKLNNNADTHQVEESLVQLAINNHSPQVEDDGVVFKLQSIKEIHLDGEHGSYLSFYDIGNKKTVFIFSSIAIFILVLAIINFINLTTASSNAIKKELSIRKVLGASRKNLIKHIYLESFVVIFMAFDIAVLITELFLKYFNNLTGKEFSLSNMLDLKLLTFMSILFLVVWIISGTYPALKLSSIGKNRNPHKLAFTFSNKNNPILRKSLVVFQFFITAILITSFLTIFKQISYIKNKDIGFEPKNIMYIPMKGDFANKYDQVKERLLNLELITYVTNQDYLWADLNNRSTGFYWEGKDPDYKPEMHIPQVGFEYVEALDMEIVAGRSFNKNYATDSNAYILTESAVNKIGVADPLGMQLKVSDGSNWHTGNIIGVVKDFNFKSLKTQIEPMVLRFDKKPGENTTYGQVLIKYKEGYEQEVIQYVKNIWNEVNPNLPFDYNFLIERYDKLYEKDKKVFKVITSFALLTILISCLGLYGLITFTIERREKEIGIRKANGAVTTNIIVLLIKEFIILVFIGFTIAIPFSYFFMSGWLDNYAYKTNLSVWPFAVTLLILIIISILSIIYKSVKASLKNPVDILRYE